MQVTLSWDDTVVPEGQLPTQVPLERKNPGKQEVHFFWFTVDATLKLGIWQAVHLAPQAERKKHQLGLWMKFEHCNLPSHSRLLLSAIRPDPWQTPFALADTHAPLKVKRPVAQTMQSLEVPPVHVWHDEEHGEQVDPVLKLPTGHVWPVVVIDWGGLHLVGSFASWENPDLQAVQSPVPSAHWVQPNWQTK